MNPEEGLKEPGRIAMGVGGFVILLFTAPCVLTLFRSGYAGSDDLVGLFGVLGIGGFLLFTGLVLLYRAFTREASE